MLPSVLRQFLFENDDILRLDIFVQAVEKDKIAGIDPGIHVRARHMRDADKHKKQPPDNSEQDHEPQKEKLIVLHGFLRAPDLFCQLTALRRLFALRAGSFFPDLLIWNAHGNHPRICAAAEKQQGRSSPAESKMHAVHASSVFGTEDASAAWVDAPAPGGP